MAAPLPDQPTGTSNAKEAARGAIAAINVSLPATVVSFDAATQTATVRPVPMFRRRDPNDKAGVLVYSPPDIPGVPVAYPGTGDFSIFWPLEVGDEGRIVCCDRSIDEWKSEGGPRTEPQDLRRHDLTDAIFVPDIRSPGANPLPSAARHATAMVIRAGELRLGSSGATEFVALANLVLSELSAIWLKFNTHVHAGTDSGGDTFTTLVPTDITGGASSVAASKVRAE